MRIWADRLGPILNQIVGGHQLGFIPGRDGRENILNLQFQKGTRCCPIPGPYEGL
jgi:hypothetical protein